jgi:hypothetical protein
VLAHVQVPPPGCWCRGQQAGPCWRLVCIRGCCLPNGCGANHICLAQQEPRTRTGVMCCAC